MVADPKTVHVMLDLETLGTRPGSAIRSVGAATFDLCGDHIPTTFSANVKAMSCWAAGMTVDQSTLDWWAKPEMREANEAVKANQRDVRVVFDEFHAWFRKTGAKNIWCQGAGFDVPLWESAARLLGLATPWKFWDVSCTRTSYLWSGLDQRTVRRDGLYHSALDDALHQIKCVQEAYRMLKK